MSRQDYEEATDAAFAKNEAENAADTAVEEAQREAGLMGTLSPEVLVEALERNGWRYVG